MLFDPTCSASVSHVMFHLVPLNPLRRVTCLLLPLLFFSYVSLLIGVVGSSSIDCIGVAATAGSTSGLCTP